MLKRLLLTSTAAIAIASTGAMAQSAAPQPQGQQQQMGQHEYLQLVATNDHLASNLIGKSVYASDTRGADTIGDINDLVVNDDGTIDAVIIGVGGFLGVGEKDVAVHFDSIQWTIDANGDRFAVLTTSKEELEAAPEFDVSLLTPSARPEAPAASNQAELNNQNQMNDMAANPQVNQTQDMAANPPTNRDQGVMATQPEANRDMAANPPTQMDPGMTARPEAMPQTDRPTTLAEAGSISVNDLIDATVYGGDDTNLGNISDVLLTQNGNIDVIIVDVGGFLGIGAKPVAISFEALDFATDDNGDLVVRTTFTRDQLDVAPQYDEETYAAQRDLMRLTPG